MPTTDFTSGFESPVTGWSVVGGATYSTATVHAGAQSLECNTSAAAAYLIYANPAGKTRVDRFYVRYHLFPLTTSTIFQYVNANGNISLKVTSGGVVELTTGTSGDISTGVHLAWDTWYLVDIKADTTTGTATATCTINGGGSTTASAAQT